MPSENTWEDERSLKLVAPAAANPLWTAFPRKKQTDTGQHRKISAAWKEAVESIGHPVGNTEE